MQFTEDYPNKAPLVRFESKMFHPNSKSRSQSSLVFWHNLADVPCRAVYADGGICLDILQNQWSPIYDVSAILTSIQVCLPCFSRVLTTQATSSHGLTCGPPPQSLLYDPNPNSPANSEAARLYNESRHAVHALWAPTDQLSLCSCPSHW